MCAAVRACQDASIGCRPSPERKRTRSCQCREKQTSWFRHRWTACARFQAKGMPPRARRRFDGINAIEPRIKILEPGNRSKVLRPPRSRSQLFSKSTRFHPLFASKRTVYTARTRSRFPLDSGSDHVPRPRACLSRPDRIFRSVLDHGFFPEAVCPSRQKGNRCARINKSAWTHGA